MSERDRLVLIAAVVLGVLVCTWMFVVSPERKSASAADQAVAAAQQTLTTAQTALGTAQTSKARYASSYTALVAVGKAVPATPEVPSLMYQLDQAASLRNVNFASITAGSGSGSTAAASSTTSTGTASSGPTPLPFTFSFTGTFFDLYHLLGRLNTFAVQTKSGTLVVTGRLLTIQGVSLTGSSSGGTAASSSGGSSSGTTSGGGELTGLVTASAYVMSPASPSSGSTGGGATTAPAAGGTSASGTPAVIQPSS